MIRTVLTSTGHKRLQTELAERRCERDRLVEAIDAGRSAGREIDTLEQEYTRNQKRLEHLQRHLAQVEVVDVPHFSGNQIVGFGATVVVKDRTCGATRKWQIVGELEADAAEGRISIISPIARELIGKACGSVVNCQTPGGGAQLEIQRFSTSNGRLSRSC
jgi:transcription elongation factor GreA